jgi:type IV secretory pathway VirB10-like protein
MLDKTTAGPGHNNPPPYDPDELAKFDATVTEFLSATQQWLAMDKIETDTHAGQITDQITGLRGLWKKVDEARKAAKKPHDEAGKAVQKAYAPLLEKLTKAADKLKPKLAAYASEKARREAEARQKAEEEARAKAESAAAAQKEAEASGDISAQVEAEEAAKEAEQMQKDAARKTATNVKSASGAGRTMSLRKIPEVEITNINVLFLHYRDHPDVRDLLQRLATAEVRAKGYDHDKAPVPGINLHFREVMA